MDTENPPSTKETLPFVILAISVIILLAWASKNIMAWQSTAPANQASAAVAQPAQGSADNAALNQYLEWQLTQIATTRENVMKSQKEMEDFISTNMPKYDAAVGKADQVTEALKKLAGDLLELSKTDDNAKEVVDSLYKAGIKFQGPPAGAQSPAP